jgi:hypothetical protein
MAEIKTRRRIHAAYYTGSSPSARSVCGRNGEVVETRPGENGIVDCKHCLNKLEAARMAGAVAALEMWGRR